MIRAGFLPPEDRTDLIALARDGSVEHRLARRANALVLLDAGWSCEKVTQALFLDDDTMRKWHGMFLQDGFYWLAAFRSGRQRLPDERRATSEAEGLGRGDIAAFDAPDRRLGRDGIRPRLTKAARG